MIKRLFIVILFFILLAPLSANAAILYFSPESGQYGPGDEFRVDIMLDVEENCINTVDASVTFNPAAVQLVDFSVGDSILSIWVTRPTTADIPAINEAGKLEFSGGIPGGYCGKIPGDPGESNIVGSLFFRVPAFSVYDEKVDTINLALGDTSQVFINDGLGSRDELVLKGAEFIIGPQPSLPQSDWDNVIKQDKTPPEPFVVELRSDPSIYDGKYYVYFSTVDKQSGIDHYEILEIKPGQQVGVAPEMSILDKLLNRTAPAPAWQTATIPYVLNDQSLESIIRVKAVDKAGNERVVEYIPAETAGAQPAGPANRPHTALIVISLSVFILIIIIVIIFIKITRRKHENF